MHYDMPLTAIDAMLCMGLQVKLTEGSEPIGFLAIFQGRYAIRAYHACTIHHGACRFVTRLGGVCQHVRPVRKKKQQGSTPKVHLIHVMCMVSTSSIYMHAMQQGSTPKVHLILTFILYLALAMTLPLIPHPDPSP